MERGKEGKFDLRSPKTREPMVTKIVMGDDARDRYHVQNFIRIQSGISLPAPRAHGGISRSFRRLEFGCQKEQRQNRMAFDIRRTATVSELS